MTIVSLWWTEGSRVSSAFCTVTAGYVHQETPWPRKEKTCKYNGWCLCQLFISARTFLNLQTCWHSLASSNSTRSYFSTLERLRWGWRTIINIKFIVASLKLVSHWTATFDVQIPNNVHKEVCKMFQKVHNLLLITEPRSHITGILSRF